MEGFIDAAPLELFGGASGVLISIVGFFLKKLYDRFQKIQEEVKLIERELVEHRVHDAKLYVEKSELSAIKSELKYMNNALQSKLQSIEEHLRLHYDRRSS